jgi:DNA-directed RNA polymerase subunit RPC12/RpoP
MTEPAQIALRRERRLAELGTRTPICVYCGETAIECLELHLVDETLAPKLTEIRCRNCHWKIEWRKIIDPVQIAVRREQQLARLGARTPICIYCDETAIECLELHHVVGKKLDSTLTEIRCRNCHRKIEFRRDVLGLTGNGIRTTPVLTKNEILRLRLLGLAESHESQAQALRHWAQEIDP